MQKLWLQYNQILNGSFQPRRLNCLLVFQVNCPGCFLYAFPLFQNLFEQYASDEVGFLAISTAFEDFELNTIEHAQALIEDGTLIGETKKALHDQGIEKYPGQINFPIGLDAQVKEFDQLEKMAHRICQINPNYRTWPEFEQQALQNRVLEYLTQLERVPATFTANQFRGTPTIVLFNEGCQILQSWFGHVNRDVIGEAIKSRLD